MATMLYPSPVRFARPGSVLAIATLAAVALVASACGSGSTATSRQSSTANGTGTTAPSGATAPSSTAGIPPVANATNLKAEPVVGPGQPPPPSKLLTKDLVVGTGAVATSSSTVLVKYVGAAYTSGKDFTASTWTQGKPTSFSLHTVVPGFAEGIAGMKVGGRREIVIPPSLGYGASGSGAAIKPNETLVFVVDLESVS